MEKSRRLFDFLHLEEHWCVLLLSQSRFARLVDFEEHWCVLEKDGVLLLPQV